MLNEQDARPFTSNDIRFTRKGDALYAIFLDWPQLVARINALGRSNLPNSVVERVDLVGGPPLQFKRDDDAIHIDFPRPRAGAFVPVVRIRGKGIV